MSQFLPNFVGAPFKKCVILSSWSEKIKDVQVKGLGYMKKVKVVVVAVVLFFLMGEASLSASVPTYEAFYLRSNLLSPLTNIGTEYCIGNNWSVAADYYFPWIPRNSKNRNCFQLLGWNMEGRYWFGKDRGVEDRLEGHSVGLNLAAGYYDIERNYKGRQGEFASVGVDYLYALPVCKDRLHLEFSLGLGYIYSYVRPYNVFVDGGLAYKTDYTERFSWFGPTKASVSLVVPIKFKRRGER